MKRFITDAEFADRCFEIFDDVAKTGQEVFITKAGKPVAKVMPPDRAQTDVASPSKRRKRAAR